MQNPEPKRPEILHPLAGEILEQLKSHPASGEIILGGGVALQHYCAFRETKDIDAWWHGAPVPQTRVAIQEAMKEVAGRHGYTVKTRSWGETESYELQEKGRTVFSFQIALRTRELESPKASVWAPVQVETLRENIGAKMNALVLRGAPRDFLDIYEVCRRGLATSQECWDLWQSKNPDKDLRSARANVARNIEQLIRRRSIESITDDDERQRTEAVRRWLKVELCRGTSRGPELGW